MITLKGPCVILFALALFVSSRLFSQDRMMRIGDMKADSATITSIAIYPRDIRMNILQACQAPEALVKMDNLQKNSSGRFQSALSPYSREVQEKIYDMARYPGLIKKLDGSDRKKRKDINKIAEEYPEEIRETINDYGRKYYELYVELSKIESETEKQFSDLISDYPEKQRVALNGLTKRPEVIGLLTSDMRSAVVAGDLYKRKPEWLMQFMDSLAAENAKQNAKSLEAWKNGLESNPEAKKEFEQASKEYARQQGKAEDDYAPVQNIQINYYAYPYSYWYGYPYWYSYPYWYNVPLWYDWGYYYGTAGWVYMGYPSPYFMHWYFHHHQHHYNYYYFTDYCVGHYYSYPHVISPFHQQVHVWIQGTKKEVPPDFFNADPERPLRIREYAKLTTEHQEFVQQNPGKKIDKLEYAANNKERYPYLAKQIEAQPKLPEQMPEQQKPGQPQKDDRPVSPDQPKPPLKKQQQDQPATPDLGEPKKQETKKQEPMVNPPVEKPVPQPQKQEPVQQPEKEVKRPNMPQQPPAQPMPKSQPKMQPVPTPRTNPQPPRTIPRPMPKPQQQPIPKRPGK